VLQGGATFEVTLTAVERVAQGAKKLLGAIEALEARVHTLEQESDTARDRMLLAQPARGKELGDISAAATDLNEGLQALQGLQALRRRR
jgi:hypothetical protein